MKMIPNLIERLLDKVIPFNADSVLASHNRAIARLEKVAENRRQAADVSLEAARDLLADAKDHAGHAARAERIAARMKAVMD